MIYQLFVRADGNELNREINLALKMPGAELYGPPMVVVGQKDVGFCQAVIIKGVE